MTRPVYQMNCRHRAAGIAAGFAVMSERRVTLRQPMTTQIVAARGDAGHQSTVRCIWRLLLPRRMSTTKIRLVTMRKKSPSLASVAEPMMHRSHPAVETTGDDAGDSTILAADAVVTCMVSCHSQSHLAVDSGDTQRTVLTNSYFHFLHPKTRTMSTRTVAGVETISRRSWQPLYRSPMRQRLHSTATLMPGHKVRKPPLLLLTARTSFRWTLLVSEIRNRCELLLHLHRVCTLVIA